jgi:hypothetical protein
MENYKMENVNFIKLKDLFTNEVKEYAIIDRGNGEFTSMTKETYDAQQAAFKK